MMKQRVLLSILLCVLAPLAEAQFLPKLAVPENYKLNFTPDLATATFTGEETIHIRVLQPTSQIVLNAAAINFQSAEITSGGATQTAKVTLDEPNETATLAVEQPLKPGAATIHIRYSGILGNDLRGFYLGKDEEGRKYATTQFEATDARRAFPSFDEPAYKATFDVTVVAPQDLTVISNGKMISDTPEDGAGKHTVHFATSPKMSSYLVAVIVGHFEYVEGSADGIPIRVFSPQGRKEMGTYALEAAEHILHYYDQYFGIKYPYGKLDLIGLPDFSAGAMENTACITFRESLLLLDPEHASVQTHKSVASVIAHEMAHQWFGDLVTMQWWNDVWLNEGFATWMSSKPLEAWKPEWQSQLDVVQDTVRALSTDSLTNTRPIHQEVDTPREIQGLFDAIAYQKAAAVLGMLEADLGPQTFQAGVNQYLKAHAYANAAAADFWGALAHASKKPVDKIMPTFVNQPGAPIVSVNNQCAGNTTEVTLQQQRYFYDRAKFAAGTDELWEIPVCLKSGAKDVAHAAEKCVLLSQKEETFKLPGCATWVMANAGAKGYYRSSYQPSTVHALSRDAESALTPAERIMLLADAWAAVRVGRESIGDYMALAEDLQSDRNPAVMRQLLAQLDYVNRYLVDSGDRAQYQDWVRRLLEPAAKKLGLEPKPGENIEQKSLRSAVLRALGAIGKDPEVLTEARQQASQALENPSAADPELASVFFALAAENGDAALYDEVLASLKSAKTPEQYNRSLGTLADFTDPKLLQRTLDYAVSPDVRSQDAMRLVSGVMQNPAGRDLAWEFIHSHWTDVENAGGPFASGQLVRAAGSFCDASQVDVVKDFFSNHQGRAASRSLRQSLELINECADLKSQQSPKLASWLSHSGGSAAK